MNKIYEGFLSDRIARKAVLNRMNNVTTLLQYKMKNDPKNKDKYEKQYRAITMATMDKNGDGRKYKDLMGNIRALGKDKDLRKTLETSEDEIQQIKDKDNDGWWEADGEAMDHTEQICTNDEEYRSQLEKYESEQADRNSTADNEIKQEKDQRQQQAQAEQPKKDADGNILKQEEITNADGKKIKVVTHTGPRGGKFYYPEGSPKDDEHKVYVSKNGKVKESLEIKPLNIFLSSYLND